MTKITHEGVATAFEPACLGRDATCDEMLRAAPISTGRLLRGYLELYSFVEPKFMQDGLVEVRNGDIIANLPYHPSCTLWFDHHITNTTPQFDRPIVPGKGGFRLAPSAARVVCEYYNEISKPNEPVAAAHLAFLNSQRMKYLLDETETMLQTDPGRCFGTQRSRRPHSTTTDGRNAGDEPYWLRVIELLREETLENMLNDSEVQRRCRQILDEQDPRSCSCSSRICRQRRLHFRVVEHVFQRFFAQQLNNAEPVGLVPSVSSVGGHGDQDVALGIQNIFPGQFAGVDFVRLLEKIFHALGIQECQIVRLRQARWA